MDIWEYILIQLDLWGGVYKEPCFIYQVKKLFSKIPLLLLLLWQQWIDSDIRNVLYIFTTEQN